MCTVFPKLYQIPSLTKKCNEDKLHAVHVFMAFIRHHTCNMTSELWNLQNIRVKEEDLFILTYKCMWKSSLCRGHTMAKVISCWPLTIVTVGLGSRFSTFACHCKFTSTPACHINLGNYSSLSVSFFFWHLLAAGIQMVKFSGAMKVCPAWTSLLNKPFCEIYNGMDAEHVLHLTLVLLCKGCFSPPITDRNHTVCNRGIVSGCILGHR